MVKITGSFLKKMDPSIQEKMRNILSYGKHIVRFKRTKRQRKKL